MLDLVRELAKICSDRAIAATLNRLGYQTAKGLNWKEVRVRSFGDVAKIEVPTNMLKLLNENYPEIDLKLKSIGYNKSEIDNEGFVSGKMNRVLS